LETSVNKKRLRKFYYLSLLCLFPILGTLIGIFLLFYAIFVFRSLKLILVILLTMAGGIVLFKVDSYYLKREFDYGEDSQNGFALLARDDLDEIVRELELYKLKYNDYPDSLPQLTKDNFLLPIIDPMQRRNPSDHKHYFYYEKKGDKYQLFSAGKDGMPNTADDIYPSRPLQEQRH
jgi:hypothetical protein